MEEKLCCPHCREDLGLEYVSKLREQHQISIRVAPKAGELVSTRTLGDTITNFGKVLEAVGRQIGTTTHVLIERISTDEEGGHVIECLITRVERGLSK